MSERDGGALTADEQARLDRLVAWLRQGGADFSILTHEETVATASMGAEQGVGTLRQLAPTLVLESEQGAIAAVLRGDRRLSYRKIKKALHLKNVSLATPDRVLELTGSSVGTISLVNRDLPTIVDEQVVRVPSVYGGCAVPRRTLRIASADLVRLTAARVFDFTEPKV